MNIRERTEQLFPYMQALRREFHRNPEVSFKEFRTSRRVQEELEKIGVPFYVIPETTNVVAEIRGGRPGKTILLRADMDALPVQEMTDLPFKSEVDGAMHACGHDGHTAALLGAAKILKEMQDELPGNVRLLFESGEEFRGSFEVVEASGALDGVDHCFGIHILSTLPVGKISIEEGPRMAGTELFTLKVTGKGAHASAPEAGIDALVCSASIIMNLQTIVSRELAPMDTGLVTIGKMTAGQRFNIIPEEAVLEGNLRYYDPRLELGYKDMIERIAFNTAAAFRCKCEMTLFGAGTPAIINSAEAAKRGQAAVTKLFGADAVGTVPPWMAGEDFAFYINKLTGCFAFVGGGFPDRENPAHHNNRFDIHEDSLMMSAALHAQYALDWLTENAM